MKNVLIASALFEHARIYLIDSRQIVEEARKLHDLWPTSCAALGRVLSMTALLGLMQKEEEETVTVTINGGGRIGTIMATAKGNGEVKGFCSDGRIYEKYEGSGKLAVGAIVGTDGYLKVARNLKMRRSYTSQVKLQSGEIGDDFAYYFVVSEQVPSIVSVGVLIDTDDSVRSAGALIIELLPGHTEEDITYLESLQLQPISSVLAENDDLKSYLFRLFPDAVILEERQAYYHCDCSKERFLRKLTALPLNDLQELSNDEDIEIRCEFCEKVYHFQKSDIGDVIRYVSDQK